MTEPATLGPKPATRGRKALVIGALGQDGTYLTEHLLNLGYEVIGTTHGQPNTALPSARSTLQHLDLRDLQSIASVLETHQPDEIYNLGARASSASLYDDPVLTGEINGLAVTRLLDAIRLIVPRARLCQALSSEIFAGAPCSPQNENTPVAPVNPYGAAKAYALHILQSFRHQKDLFACGAILYNHESPLRPPHFVTRKVTQSAARIAQGDTALLQLGSAHHRRDWGHARDSVRALHLMLQHPEPEDFVIATGVTHSVETLCSTAFSIVGLDYRQHVHFSPDPIRRDDRRELRGDAGKARRLLGWEPQIPFDALIREMVEADLAPPLS